MNVLLNVYICAPGGRVHLYTPGTTPNSQRTPTNINKNVVVTKVRILVEQGYYKAFKDI